MVSAILGFVTGAIFFGVMFYSERYMAMNYRNWLLVGIVPILAPMPILLSVLVFSPFVDRWETFIQVWGLGFAAGVLTIKFAFFERFYK